MLDPKYKSTHLLSSVVILIGDVRVGKTSFLYSATGKSQNNIQPTMGIDFMSTSVPLHGKVVKIEIWDTSNYHKKLSRCVNLPIDNIDILQEGTGRDSDVRHQQQSHIREYETLEPVGGPESTSVDQQNPNWKQARYGRERESITISNIRRDHELLH
jgi:hypothetical protein